MLGKHVTRHARNLLTVVCWAIEIDLIQMKNVIIHVMMLFYVCLFCKRIIVSYHEIFLDKQLNFNPTHRYNAVNRLYKTLQIALNLEQVDNDYFKLIVQPNRKILSVINKHNTPSIEEQESTGDETQHWDVIPTGEKDYFRIKTRSEVFNHMNFGFLQVADNDTIHVNLGRRDDTYLGQQWRLI